MLVDSGAIYSVLPAKDWKLLGLKPEDSLSFSLADGTTIERQVSQFEITLLDRTRTSPVVLGQGDDEALLGAVTLESLGFMINPLNRKLVPMRLLLAASSPFRA